MRRALALAAVFVFCLVAPATAGGPDHFVNASPTADGLKIHRADVIASVTGAPSVDSTNVARATPHDCTGCEGIAVAFQAVIATGHPSNATPTNVALAVNTNCTSCGAFAYAYQYYVTADRGAHLSPQGQAAVADIERQADALVDQGLAFADLNAQLDTLAQQFHDAVLQDLQAGHPRAGASTTHFDEVGQPA